MGHQKRQHPNIVWMLPFLLTHLQMNHLKTRSVLNWGSHTSRRAAAAREPPASVRILAKGEIPVLARPANPQDLLVLRKLV
jgi:hypothetical protein